MNQFDPSKNRVEISSIFKWFKADFDKAGGVEKILGRYGPSKLQPFLAKGGYKIDYKKYQLGIE